MESNASLNYSAKEFFYDNSFKDYEQIKPKFFDLIDIKLTANIRFAPVFPLQHLQSVGRHVRYTTEQANRITAQSRALLHDYQELMFERAVKKIIINSVYGIYSFSHRYEAEIVKENTNAIKHDGDS